ncbi:hypothetical protein GOP47_0025406 [Adiantum capillus-veneris]|uniref:serine O-acetyltransferase n=1 Tax=Adiantum capillus-veneris TaxID=13818 RepID=A0A9D4U0P6_ADICA|nr:hypothetical protein GOP47_0025406 [Adiantum capillus-veneris]
MLRVCVGNFHVQFLAPSSKDQAACYYISPALCRSRNPQVPSAIAASFSHVNASTLATYQLPFAPALISKSTGLPAFAEPLDMDDLLLSISVDLIWREIRNDALQMGREENEIYLDMGASELLAGILQSTVLQWHSFEEALSALLASKLSSELAPKHRWHAVIHTAFTKGSSLSGTPIRSLIMEDLIAIKERDPACPSLGHAFLYFKGFHGIQLHRVANWLWQNGQRSLATLFQSRVSEVFGMDIHPAAQLGSYIMMDHATGIVIGETARVGNGCTLLHGVTLGGNGKQQGDRHPKLGMNVLVGAGASILGNVTIGNGAKIGASAVVLSDIPSFATAVGCPAKVSCIASIDVI